MEQVKRDAVIKNATEITLHMIKKSNQMIIPNEKLGKKYLNPIWGLFGGYYKLILS